MIKFFNPDEELKDYSCDQFIAKFLLFCQSYLSDSVRATYLI